MRKMKWIAFLFGVLFLLSACHPAATLPEESDEIGGINASDLEESSKEQESSEEPVSQEEKPEAKYLNPEDLEAITVGIVHSRTFEDRTITIEDMPVNEPEMLTYMLQYCATLPDFEQYKALHGAERVMQLQGSNLKEKFEKGVYFTEYTFHKLETIDEETMLTLNSGYVKEFMDRLIGPCKFTEYVLVESEFTMVHSEASILYGPQSPSGRYTYYYLWAKTTEDDTFKLFDVYWKE